MVLGLGPLSPLVIGRMADTTPASAALAMRSLQERDWWSRWRPEVCGCPRRAGRDGAATVATILIVDDEPDVRFLLKMVFEAAGHRIVQAHHGAVALERLRSRGRT